MFPNFQRYMELKYGPAKNYPRRSVTASELILLLVSQGESEDKAKAQVEVARGLGSAILVGKEWLSVNDAEEVKK